MKRIECLICGSNKISNIIQLGMHPFADTFIDISRYHEPDKVYQLNCAICENCGHIQTQYITNPDERYADHDYSYTSSNSSFSKNHWVSFIELLFSKKLIESNNTKVLEVGSNDGFIGRLLAGENIDYLGIDASPFMTSLAIKNNVQTITGLFGPKVVQEIKKRLGLADLIIANNVLNHADNILEFIDSINKILSPNGSFIFEVPYWLIDFKNYNFDKIYHEHVSYFTLRPLNLLFRKFGFYIEDFEVIDYHGGSLRVIAKRGDKPVTNNLNRAINKEISLGVFQKESYQNYMNQISLRRYKFLKKIYQIKFKKNKIVAVGAAARGNTILNFYRLDSNVLDYVTDISPLKVNKYTPLSRIKIVKDDVLADYQDVYAMLLTNNISDNLKNLLKKINSKIKFITI